MTRARAQVSMTYLRASEGRMDYDRNEVHAVFDSGDVVPFTIHAGGAVYYVEAHSDGTLRFCDSINSVVMACSFSGSIHSGIELGRMARSERHGSD